MAQKFVHYCSLFAALVLTLCVMTGQAQAQTSKRGANPVNAIIDPQNNGAGTSGTATSGPTTQANQLDVPTTKLAVVFLVICVLIYLTYFGLKRYMNWSRGNTNRKRAVGVVDTIPLGGKKFVSVTRIYDRVLVLGVGEDSISLLTELTDDEVNSASAKLPEKTKSSEHFMNILNSFSGKRTVKGAKTIASSSNEEAAIL